MARKTITKKDMVTKIESETIVILIKKNFFQKRMVVFFYRI